MAASTSQPYGQPLALREWVEENKHLLKPPVCNKLVYGAGMWKAMVVGGPNERTDYHIEEGEEYFLMLKGSMCLKVIERGQPRDIAIREGEMLMLPARIPHSPNRFADTIGLVMERERAPGEMDGLRYYTSDFQAVLYEEWFHCTDLGKDLKPIIDRFHASDAKRTGIPVPNLPPPPVEVESEATVAAPIPFAEWLAGARAADGAPAATMGRSLFPDAGRHNFAVDVYWGPCSSEPVARAGEVMLFQHSGNAAVHVDTTADTGAAGAGAETMQLQAGQIVLLPPGARYHVIGAADDCVGLEFYVRGTK